MNDDTDDSGGVIFEGPFDPDAQATVTDFIDYTEYLPSDLIRSLTLIRGLDETYLDATQKVHELTAVYGRLPELPVESRRNPQELREQISHHLNRALNAREASHAEACRIYDVVDRHYDRLGNIKRKLEALPKPASRDPTPPAKRSKGGRKTDKGATRITLRVDGQGTDRTGAPKSRNRRSMVSGLHPDSPIASTEQSDNEAPKVRSRRGGPVLNTGLEPVVRPKKDKKRARPRPPGPGTNVHSSVAGISTSNALALLKPPPEDAKLGSEDLPWLRLTDWEMTKLRKKMKKNAIWQPSEIMINRELANGGRGWEGYRAAKAKALAAGEELIDCDDIENTYVPGKLIRKSEATADMSAAEEIKTSNRGMILNEAKRLKRENLAREQEAASAAAAAAAEAELAAKRLSDIGSTFKRLFSTSGETSQVATTETINSNGAVAPSTAKSRSKTTRKRKAEENSLLLERAELSEPSSKRQNTGKPQISEITDDITEGPETLLEDTKTPDRSRSRSKVQKVASTSPQQTRAPSTTSQASASREQISTTVISNIHGATTRTPSVTRPSSRRRSEAAPSTEPGSAVNTALAGVSREHLRRASVTPATKTPAPETAIGTAGSATSARRKKRPAPGPVSSTGEGGATLSHGKRKSKPKKRAPGKETIKGEDYRIDEDGVLEKIDPNEPRYCLCKDVSFGTMINCENPDCEGEWFHLECVGLQEPPSRRAKWFCPECRVKLKKAPDGIERVGGGRR